MKVSAFYKTFRGEEFVIPSLRGIINHVDDVFMLHSGVGWDGREGNTVLDKVAHSKEFGEHKKINHYLVDLKTQEEQYSRGLSWVIEESAPDIILLVDTDEVWEPEELERALYFIEKIDRLEHDAYACRMHTYIKDVRYRILPPEPCMPVVFLRGDVVEFSGVRGNRIDPRCDMENIFMHHFSYVRKDWETVKQKIITSTKGDGLEHVDLDVWKRQKWDRLPNAKNLHTSKGYETYWEGVEVMDNKVSVL